jgi:predicted metal-dependent peptidase
MPNKTGTATALTKDYKQEGQAMVTKFTMILRNKCPFLYTIALFTKFIPATSVAVAATNGICVYFNVEVFSMLGAAQRNYIFVHEIYHMILSHVARSKKYPEVNSRIWNAAADIYINNGCMPTLPWCTFPEKLGGINEPDLLRDSTEEIYALLLKKQAEEKEGKGNKKSSSKSKGKSKSGKGAGSQSTGKSLEEILSELVEDLKNKGDISEEDASAIGEELTKMTPEELEDYWKRVILIANTNHLSSKSVGNLPAGLQRLVDEITDPQLPWQSILINYLVKHPFDYEGFDRRFIHRGIYQDWLDGDSVQAYVCIDTSGSVGQDDLTLFAAELKGILSSYPHIKLKLYFADCALYGPYDVETLDDIPEPQGGGGTSFDIFFKEIEEDKEFSLTSEARLAIYLTDGYASFNFDTPSIDTLWVLTPTGVDKGQIPFGEVTRLIEH